MRPADYFAINTLPAAFAKLGMHVDKLPILSQMVGENVAVRPGGGVSLAVGMDYIMVLMAIIMIDTVVTWISKLTSEGMPAKPVAGGM